MAFYNLASGLMTSSIVSTVNEKVSFDQLLEMFKDSEQLAVMSNSDKILVTLFVTALGMTVTFAVLVFLWFCISMFAKLISSIESSGKNKGKVTEVTQVIQNESVEEVEDEDEELIAVISAAVAASMNTSIHNIVVRNIVSVNDHSPSWSKTGRIEQMNTRF